jgi:hypothetical protein
MSQYLTLNFLYISEHYVIQDLCYKNHLDIPLHIWHKVYYILKSFYYTICVITDVWDLPVLQLSYFHDLGWPFNTGDCLIEVIA